MKNIKFFLGSLFVLALLFVSQVSHAEGEVVRLTLKNNGSVFYSDNLDLPAAGMASLNDTSLTPHDVDARSVLNMISIADTASSSFNISDLMYYSSFSAFYLKCIYVDSELCDNWQYKVNDIDPGVGMDQKILSGGENIVMFFGEENPAPEPVVIRHSGGANLIASSGGGGSVTPTVSAPLIVAPVPEQNVLTEVKNEPIAQIIEVPIENPKEVVQMIEIKKVENKKTIARKNLTPKKEVVSNTASTVYAVSDTQDQKIINQPVVKKSWIRRLFSSIFGF